MGVPYSERYLIEIASSTQDDALQRFLRLADFAEGGVGFRLTVAVEGLLFRGDLMRSEYSADATDAALDAALMRYERETENEQAATGARMFREALRRNSLGSHVRERRERERKMVERLEEFGEPGNISVDDLDDDLAREYLEHIATRSSFALYNAVVAAPPALHDHEVGVVWIKTSKVNAWWLS
jgi:hypothetical protein